MHVFLRAAQEEGDRGGQEREKVKESDDAYSNDALNVVELNNH